MSKANKIAFNFEHPLRGSREGRRFLQHWSCPSSKKQLGDRILFPSFLLLVPAPPYDVCVVTKIHNPLDLPTPVAAWADTQVLEGSNHQRLSPGYSSDSLRPHQCNLAELVATGRGLPFVGTARATDRWLEWTPFSSASLPDSPLSVDSCGSRTETTTTTINSPVTGPAGFVTSLDPASKRVAHPKR